VAHGPPCSRSQDIADFRKDNGRAIRQVCVRFVALCRTMGLLTQAAWRSTAASSRREHRDKTSRRAKMDRRMAQIEESVARYLQQLDTVGPAGAVPKRSRPRRAA